jgi:hypothetical protein
VYEVFANSPRRRVLGPDGLCSPHISTLTTRYRAGGGTKFTVREMMHEHPETIRVVDVRRSTLDVASAPLEEVYVALDSVIAAEPTLDRARESTRSTLEIAGRLQGPLSSFIRHQTLKRAPQEEVLPEIVARELLLHPSFIPVIDRSGGVKSRQQSRADVLRVRPATRVRAFLVTGEESAVAADEPVGLLGVVVDPGISGEFVIDAYGGVNRGFREFLDDGAYPGPVLRASADGFMAQPTLTMDSESSGNFARHLARRGMVLVPFRDRKDASERIDALFRQVAAAVEFTLGPGVAGSLAAVAAGRAGKGRGPLVAMVPRFDIVAEFVHRGSEQPTGAPWMPLRSHLDRDQLVYLVRRLSKTQAIATEGESSRAFDMSPLYDLYRAGALGVYLYVLFEGRESPTVDQFLERESMSFAKEQQLHALRRTGLAATTLARQYISIVEDKLGARRLAELRGKLRSGRGLGESDLRAGALEFSDRGTRSDVQVDDPSLVMSLLSPRERTLVQTEYENRKQEWAAQIGNKCPHVRLSVRLRRVSTIQEAAEVLSLLSKYFVKAAVRDAGSEGAARSETSAARSETSAATLWIKCRNCGFRIICPHVRERIQLEAKRTPYEEVRTRLLRFAVRHSGGDDHSYSYFCRICGERLAEMIDEDRTAEFMGRFGDMDAPLRTLIWSETVSATSVIRFPSPVDPRQFASTAVDIIHPLVLAAEESITVGRRGRQRVVEQASADDELSVDPRTHLYVVLFVFAYILNLIESSQKLPARDEIGFEGVKPRAKISAFADVILTHIMTSRSGVISRISDITSDFITARFKEAFRMVRGEGTDMRIKAVNAEEELAVQLVEIDPMYRYIATMARVAGKLPIGNISRDGVRSGPEAARREFETVMGTSLPSLVKNARDNAKDPELAPFYGRRAVVEVPPGTTLEFLYKNPKINMFASMFTVDVDPVRAAPFHAMRAVVAQRSVGGQRREKRPAHPGKRPAHPGKHPTYQFSRYDPFLSPADYGYSMESFSLFTEYTTKVRDRKTRDQYLDRLERVRQAEAGYYHVKSMLALKTYFSFGFTHSRQFSPIKTPLGALYDERGMPHKWDTYIFAGKDGEHISVKIDPSNPDDKSMTKARDKSVIGPESVLVDIKCSVCGALQSAIEASPPDEVKVRRSLGVIAQIDMFFAFYESRCPEGNLHDWVSSAANPPSENTGDRSSDNKKSECKKCGMVAGAARLGPDARAYYDRYEKRFEEERRELLAAEGPAQMLPAPREVSTTQEADDRWAAEWKPDYGVVVRAAEIAKTSPAVVEAVGATEGRDYDDIKEGRGAPPPPTATDDHRIMAGDSLIRAFAAEYNRLRYITRLAKPPEKLVTVLTTAGVQPHEYEALQRNLPDLTAVYRDRKEAMGRVRTPADVLQFCIEQLCRMTATLSDLGKGAGPWPDEKFAAPPANVVRLGALFAEMELVDLLRKEKLLSKHGPFNFAIFSDVADEDVVELGTDVGDVGEDVSEAIDENANEDGAYNPFSLEGMDYNGVNEEPP